MPASLQRRMTTAPPLRAVVVLLASLATALRTARLGLWQLDRAAQKNALHDGRSCRALRCPC